MTFCVLRQGAITGDGERIGRSAGIEPAVPMDRSRSTDASRPNNGSPSGDRAATTARGHQTVAIFHE